jgi:feruloyl-CoA synthase
MRDVVIVGENRDYIAVLGFPSTAEIVDDNAVQARVRAKLMALAAEASGSAQRVLRFAFLAEKLSIDTGELSDKGVVSQRNILRRHAAAAPHRSPLRDDPFDLFVAEWRPQNLYAELFADCG